MWREQGGREKKQKKNRTKRIWGSEDTSRTEVSFPTADLQRRKTGCNKNEECKREEGMENGGEMKQKEKLKEKESEDDGKESEDE